MTILQTTRAFQATLLAATLALASGCLKPGQPASSSNQPPDSQIVTDVSSKLASDPALSSQQIQTQVSSGVAVLSGTVDSDAAKALAASDAQQVKGVRSVLNNISVAPRPVSQPAPSTTVARATPPPSNRMTGRSHPPRDRDRDRQNHRQEPAPAPVAEQPPPPQQSYNQQPPAPEPPPAPAPPPAPVARTFTLPSGTVVPVRLIDSLQTGVTQSNTTFRGSLAADLVDDGMVVVRQGANITGRVIDAKDATHYTGSAALTLELTRINAGGQSVSIVTDPYTEQGKARGKNTATKVGGGAVLGAIIGGIAGGGKGAAIGSVAGGGIGAGANTVTRGEQVSLPSETIVRFRLSSPVQITVVPRTERNYDSGQPTLQPRPN